MFTAWHRSVCLAWSAAALAGANVRGFAQATSDCGSSDPVPTRQLAPGDLAGAVVAGDVCLWVRGATVVAHVRSSTGGQDSAVATTGALGLFTLHLPHSATLGSVDVSIVEQGKVLATFPRLALDGPLGHAVVFALPPAPPPPPNPVIAHSSPPVPSDTVAAGVLTGIVVDDTSGRPLRGANVYLRGLHRNTVTDSMGRFRLPLITGDSVVIAFSLLPYHPVEVAFLPAPGVGYVTLIAAHRFTPVLSCDLVGPTPYVVVRAIDALTGKPPRAGTTLVVSQSGHLESVLGAPDRYDASVWVMLAARGYKQPSSEPVALMIQSAGYVTWRQSGVVGNPKACPPGQIQRVAWLLPADPPAP